MKKKTALFLALLMTVAVLFSGCGEELGLANTEVKIKVADGKAVVTELPNKTGITEITIPDEYENAPVTEIADYSGCNLENAEKINIGKNVEKIGVWAFENNQNLKEFSVDPENKYFCSVDGVLFTKDMKELLFYPVARGIEKTEIKKDDGKTEEVERITYSVPEGVEKIRSKAFYKCEKLYSLTLPSTIKSIEEKAFFKCTSMENINLPEGVTNIDKDAFSCCSSLKAITVPGTVTAIGDYAFYNCTALLDVKMQCKKENVTLGQKWQPTDNGIEIKKVNIIWE